MERRLAAILAADVAGYSHHTELNEEASTATLRSHRAVVEESISAHRGRIFSSAGDGIVAEFPSVVEAIRCAVEFQNEIAERNAALPAESRMQFRVGVNLGDVISEENNLYGTGVNLAARLEQLALPGGICVSQTVYDQVRKIVELPFEDIGERRLKNIGEPIHVYRILPAPMSWLKSLFWRTQLRRRSSVAACVFLLFFAVAAGAVYFRQPPALWTTLLSDAGGQPAALWTTLFGGLGTPPLPQTPTIAVLPFRDISPAQDQEYLAQGVTEELTTGLAKFPDLLVMSSNSTLGYKDKPTDTRQVGKELNVRYVVSGSLQRVGPEVRVDARLADASTGLTIWSDGYQRQLSNIFAIRDDITKSVAGVLGGVQGKVAKEEIARVASKDPNSFTAYDYVMRGWHEWYKLSCESDTAARDLFEKAIKIDPDYARAHAGLAWTYSTDHDYECSDDPAGDVKKVLQEATTAVRLDDNDYQGHWALGWAYLYSREYEKAKAQYMRARELNPNDAELLAEMSNFLMYIGNTKQAVDQLERAIRLNPFHDDWYVEYLGEAYLEAGMPQQAVVQLEKVLNVENPNDDQLWFLPELAAAYADPSVGRMDDAHKVVKTILSREPDFTIKGRLSDLPYKDPEQKERHAEAFRRAGLPE
jgi:adenylate cyclase